VHFGNDYIILTRLTWGRINHKGTKKHKGTDLLGFTEMTISSLLIDRSSVPFVSLWLFFGIYCFEKIAVGVIGVVGGFGEFDRAVEFAADDGTIDLD
jgi:hypothetical protein